MSKRRKRFLVVLTLVLCLGAAFTWLALPGVQPVSRTLSFLSNVKPAESMLETINVFGGSKFGTRATEHRSETYRLDMRFEEVTFLAERELKPRCKDFETLRLKGQPAMTYAWIESKVDGRTASITITESAKDRETQVEIEEYRPTNFAENTVSSVKRFFSKG